MIRFRYRVAGAEDPPFTSQAYDAIFRYSTGLPRMICTICNTALTKAFVDQRRSVDEDLIRASAEELRAAPLDEPATSKIRRAA